MLSSMKSVALVRPQYAVVRETDTLEPLESPQPEMVALVAAYVGQTRLIDNLTIRTF
jgi:pantothenate synthetase